MVDLLSLKKDDQTAFNRKRSNLLFLLSLFQLESINTPEKKKIMLSVVLITTVSTACVALERPLLLCRSSPILCETDYL